MQMNQTTFSLGLVLSLAGAPSLAQSAAPPQSSEPVLTIGGQEFWTWEEFTRSEAFRVYGLRCGISDRDQRAFAEPDGVPGDCAYTSTTIQSEYEPAFGETLRIPVVFHVIQRSGGTGNVSDARVQQQIDVLNEDFRAVAGSNGAAGNDAGIEFFLATVDPDGNPTNGITRSTNNQWFNDGGSYWNSLAWDTNRYMNIYSNSAGGALGYVPDLPQGGLVGQNRDRVVILHSTVGRNAPIGPPFHQGRTLTHEVGHYLGLEHTFWGGCANVANCYNNGDLICDTNAQKNPTSGCPSNKSSCGTPDPTTNYMDYSNDLCMTEFTAEQINRMRCTVQNWRPDLSSSGSCALASVQTRNAGSNPAVYSATPPTLGQTQTYTVSTAPYDSALIFGRLGAASQTLPGGQVALIDLSSARAFRLGPFAGPNVSHDVSVPPDAGLCGLSVASQALLSGGTKPFALTNAVDMVLGN